MNCKLTINLNTGHLEVEGSEDLVKEIYHDFKVMIEKLPSKKTDNDGTKDIDENEEIQDEGSTSTPKVKKSNPSKSKSTSNSKVNTEMKFLTALNLRPKGKVSLKDFAAKYQIKTSEELSLLITYYLKEILQETVTLSHIFTCLKELGKKIPTHLKQVLTNNKNTKHWIDLSDWNDIKYSVAGMNHMEHDITKA